MSTDIKARVKHIAIPARKVRRVINQVRGMEAEQALEVLLFLPHAAARPVAKLISSAIANAENNNQLRPELLRVKEATVGSGRILKRWVAKARGSAGPIRKRSCNIRIVLTDQG